MYINTHTLTHRHIHRRAHTWKYMWPRAYKDSACCSRAACLKNLTALPPSCLTPLPFSRVSTLTGMRAAPAPGSTDKQKKSACTCTCVTPLPCSYRTARLYCMFVYQYVSVILRHPFALLVPHRQVALIHIDIHTYISTTWRHILYIYIYIHLSLSLSIYIYI